MIDQGLSNLLVEVVRKAVQGGNVLVLFPNHETHSEFGRLLGGKRLSMVDIAGFTVYFRVAQRTSSLKSVSVRHLIVYHPGSSDYHLNALSLARERTRGHKDPTYTEVF